MNTLNYFLTLDTTTSDTGPGPCGGDANLDCRGADADQPLEFTRQRDKLLQALAGLDADVLGLNELENTPGVEPLADIVAGLPGYDYIDTGTIGTDAIKVGLIYRPAAVTPVGTHAILTTAVDPRFIDTKSRPVARPDLRGQRHRRPVHRRRQPPQEQGLGVQRRRRPRPRRRPGQLQPDPPRGRAGARGLARDRSHGLRRP